MYTYIYTYVYLYMYICADDSHGRQACTYTYMCWKGIERERERESERERERDEERRRQRRREDRRERLVPELRNTVYNANVVSTPLRFQLITNRSTWRFGCLSLLDLLSDYYYSFCRRSTLLWSRALKAVDIKVQSCMHGIILWSRSSAGARRTIREVKCFNPWAL